MVRLVSVRDSVLKVGRLSQYGQAEAGERITDDCMTLPGLN